MANKKNLRVLDLFSGCGGLSFGFAKSGFEIVAGLDNWSDSLVTFEKNHPGSKGVVFDLGDFNKKELDKIVSGKIDVVVGGPPCQGFSISGKRNPEDPRNKLYIGFVEVVKYLKPKAFLLENVPNLVSMSGGKIKDSIINDFIELGYDVKYKILLASDYGVPQNRRRVVFVGMLKKNDFEFPEGKYKEAQYKITSKQAISDLPEGSVEDGATNGVKPKSEYQKLMRKKTGKIFNHQISEHNKKTIDTIALVPDGGNYKDLPENLQDTRKVNIAWTRYNSCKPSNTIDTGHRHHFHYKYNRIPTVRESARLQSFPDDFIFYGSKTSQYKQVGNAVPPIMAEQIGKALKKALNK
jgi:DNA (cytosine-5)-methyltransferase 1